VQTFQARSIRVALELNDGTCGLGLLLVIFAPIFTTGELNEETFGVGVVLFQSLHLRILRAMATVVESDDREAEFGAAVSILWCS
jgi:hypothetical protein